MYAHGMTGLRWYSWVNEWMDFIVYVPDDRVEDAILAIHMGIDVYWDNECECYGDAVEASLKERNIPYIIIYQEWDHDNDRPVDWWEWDRFVGEIAHNVICIAH